MPHLRPVELGDTTIIASEGNVAVSPDREEKIAVNGPYPGVRVCSGFHQWLHNREGRNVAKKRYPTQDAAEETAAAANTLAPGFLGEYVPWKFRDSVAGERKWFIRRKPRR